MSGYAYPPNGAMGGYRMQDPWDSSRHSPDIGLQLDPALGGSIPPAPGQVHIKPVPQHEFAPYSSGAHPPRQFSYDQGPQGDPFAVYREANDRPAEHYVPQPTTMPKPRPPRQEVCGFCQGTDHQNKNNQPEYMASCAQCGRSGHPSCMNLGDTADVLHSYDWLCQFCTKCEAKMLLCDYCDRGWHTYCLDPPLAKAPSGQWHCPQCPPIEQFIQHEPTPEPFREVSVASTSRSAAGLGKGKGRATEPPSPVLRKPKRSHKKRAHHDSDDEQDSTPSEAPTPKRARVASPLRPRTIVLRLPGKGKGKERDEDEKGMFDDVLNEQQRDTSRSSLTSTDKVLFERSRAMAEAKIAAAPVVHFPLPVFDNPDTGPSFRGTRSSAFFPALAPGTSPAPSTPGPSAPQQPLRISKIRFGEYEIDTWFDAPFPEEYNNIPDGRMWLCEFCLKYMKSEFSSGRHRMKCKMRHPPGDEIYRDGKVSIFEVDGRKNKIYCQNLCLLSKMFLDHKSLFYDVEPFLFYVMCEIDDLGARFVGYFSKEKRSPKDYNVSCIMTLPVRQRKGFGNALIDFSYLLSKKEQRLGSPEKPLSGLGALGYKNYWTLAVMRFLHEAPEYLRLEDVSAATSMTIEDVCYTLKHLNMLSHRDSSSTPARPSPGQSYKFPKGRKNGLSRKSMHRAQTRELEPSSSKGFIPPLDYEIHWDHYQVEQYLEKWKSKNYLSLKPEKLKWSPFLIARVRKTEALEATDVGDLHANDNVLPTFGRPSSLFDDGSSRQHDYTDALHLLADAAQRESTNPSPGARRRSSSYDHQREHLTQEQNLAAQQLAFEEERTARLLRSVQQTRETSPTASNSRSVSPRKRRRFGESTSGVAVVQGEPQPPISGAISRWRSTSPADVVVEQVVSLVTPRPSPPRSALHSRHRSPVSVPPLPQEEEEGKHSPIRLITSATPPRRRSPTRRNSRSRSPPRHVPPLDMMVVSGDVDIDVKIEDMSTPSAGTNTTHGAPSDDTAVENHATEDEPSRSVSIMVDSKPLPLPTHSPGHGPVSPSSPERPVERCSSMLITVNAKEDDVDQVILEGEGIADEVVASVVNMVREGRGEAEEDGVGEDDADADAEGEVDEEYL